MIHRDIKSGNILLTETGNANVADFGIARAAMATTTGSRSGLVLGTPSYISPEQATGKPVGPRSDLYSLGVVLYEMLTGTLPYSGEDPASMTFQHVHGPLRSPRETNPDVSEPLNVLTTELLAKEPEDRYASAAELAEDLEQVRSGLSPRSVATEKTTTEIITAPLLSSKDQGGHTTAFQPRVATPIMEVFKSGGRVRGRTLRTLAMALCGVLLLGGLAWALTKDQSVLETSGSKEAPSTEEEAAPSTVQEVPELYNASEAEGALVDAGLKLGDQNEVSRDAISARRVTEQDPHAGTTVEEGTAVDIAVSMGQEQVPAALRPAPVGLGSQQPAPAIQASPPSAGDQKQIPAVQAAEPQSAPTGVDTDPRHDATAARVTSATSGTTSVSPVSEKTVQEDKK